MKTIGLFLVSMFVTSSAFACGSYAECAKQAEKYENMAEVDASAECSIAAAIFKLADVNSGNR